MLIELNYKRDRDGNLVADVSHLSEEEKRTLIEALEQQKCTCPCHQGANMMHIQPCCEECE